MRYFVYKTKNKINGMIYVGVHKTTDINDGYLGSGKFFQRALKKYGECNFEREILHECSSHEEAFKIETDIVNDDFVKDPNTYNFKVGGSGGNTLRGRKWFNNSTDEKYFHPGEEPAGWVKGRLESCSFNDSEKQRQRAAKVDRKKRSESLTKAWAEGRFNRDHTKCGTKGDNHPAKREEVKEKIRQKQLERSNEIVKCPHCGKEGKNSVGMISFHFEKCKWKK